MELSKKLVSEFVKATSVSKEKTETTVYGSIVKNNQSTYVKLDGSDILTPVSTTADTHDGERVTVLIKNHTATVTGNITSPAARTEDVQNLDASKLDSNTAENTYATITSLEATDTNVTNLEADVGDFKTSTAQNFKEVDNKIDSIVTSGASGNWTYRKWSNGDVELWGSCLITNQQLISKIGDLMYRTAEIDTPDFPFSVYSSVLTASYESDGYGALLWPTTLTTQMSPPNYYLVRPDSAIITSGKINFYVIGKWKTEGG